MYFLRIVFLVLLGTPLFGEESRALSIHIFSEKNNGKGQAVDRMILQALFEAEGHSVTCFTYDLQAMQKAGGPHAPCSEWWDSSSASSYADINLFIEKVNPDRFGGAAYNWFIPNPEWYEQDMEFLDHFDLILCRTREIERIFKELGKPTYFLGFTSPDRFLEAIPKDYASFVHLPGGSWQKGTSVIADVWRENLDFPLLTVATFFYSMTSQGPLAIIPYRVPEAEFQNLQNSCGIHLCLSETEGFGHYIMEAMSTGAVVITTDAPPMNEFITDPRCLVLVQSSARQNLATNYYVDPVSLTNKVRELMELPQNELEAIGKKNRQVYLQKQEEFHSRWNTLIDSLAIKGWR